MLDTLPPARRRLVLTLLGALLVVVVVAVALVAVDRVRAAGGVDQDDAAPVVMVPGYGGDVDSVDPLVDAARDQGRQAYRFDPPGDGTGDLRANARVLRRNDAASVDLVGYSAGGIVVRLYIADDGGGDVVRRVLTVGSPHHGTDVAALAQQAAGSCPTACEQMVPESTVLRRLDAGDETPDSAQWVTVRSDADRTVVPTDTAELEGALNLRVQSFCSTARTSHADLPSDPVTLAALSEAIGPGTPKRPADVDCG